MSSERWFSYDNGGNGFEIHESKEAAKKSAQDAMDHYESNADEGWDELSTSVCWGRVYQEVAVVDVRPRTDDDCVAPWVSHIEDHVLSDAGGIETIEALRRRVAELGDRQKTLVEAYIYDPRQWDDKESGGTATVLACLLLDKTQEFIQAHGHNPKGNVEDAFAAITAENAELQSKLAASVELNSSNSACLDSACESVRLLKDENAELKRHVEALREDAEVGALVKELTTVYMGLSFQSDGNGVSCFFADGESSADDLLGCVRVAHQIMVDEEEGGIEAAKGEVE